MTEILDETGSLGELGDIIRLAADAALNLEAKSGEVSVAVMDDEAIRALNAKYRGVDAPTDVLSFPEDVPDEGFLGDIAISLETARRQAHEYGHGIKREIAFLTAHGVLHLLGYDHIDQDDEALMRDKQRAVMAALTDRL